MPDRGAKYADKKISEIDRKLRQTYKQAQTELTRKLKDFNKRFETQDKQKRKEVSEGKITQQQYKDWLQRQVFTRSIWQQKIDQVSQVMLHHNEYAAQIVNESRFDVFAENYYAEAFRANWIIQGIDWTVYNTQALQRLIEKEPQILPEWKIDEEKDYKWNEKKVNNIVQQGIIQGESVDQITQRLCTDLSTQNENRMRLFARTAITGAQNAGRQEQMREAVAMGLEVNKRWIATMDSRTRDSHRAIEGEEVPQDENFSNGLEYPGDPSGDPAEVYNCRCTMQSVYPQYEDRSKKWREGVEIDGVPYEEWKQGIKAEKEYRQNNQTQQENSQVTTTKVKKASEKEWDKKKHKKKEIVKAGKINPEMFKQITTDITDNKVIITKERIDHCNNHDNAYDKYKHLLSELLAKPDYIFADKHENTGIMVKRFEQENKPLELILRLHTSKDEAGKQNSIISFWDIGEKTLQRYIRNKKIVYKREE